MNGFLDRMSQGKKVAAGAAISLFACMFLSWFNFGFISYDAWESLNFITPILAIVVVTTVAIALAEATDTDIGDINGGLVIFVLGCLASLLILYRLVDPISIPGGEGGSISSSVEAGAFLSFVAALGVAVGGYLATDGQAIERLKAMMPNGSSHGAGFQAGPATAAPVASPPKPRSAPPKPSPVATPEAEALVEPVTPDPEPEVETVVEFEPEPATVVEPAPAVEPPASEPTTIVAPEPQSAADEEPRSVFCEACGQPMRPNDRFCRKCGHKQAEPTSA
jgi:hypothetical protein